MADENKKQSPEQLQERLNNLIELTGSIVGRANLSSKLGYQYGGDRDIYQALGYKESLVFSDYYAQYKRQDIAKAVINRPVDATWRGPLALLEADNEEKTIFEKEWKALEKRLGLKSRFARVDRLSGIGHYGVLLLGLDDVKKKEDWQKPVAPGNRKLLYVKPLSEESAKIQYWESSTDNERYGLPTIYQVRINSPSANTSTELLVHHTRIIHITGQLMESEVQGTPELEDVFNRLKDLEKIVGGSAEMFWRGARPGYQGKVDENYQMTPDAIEDLQTQVDEYEHNLRRILVNQGVDLQGLTPQVEDPSNHVDVQIQMISAIKGIPKRILTGSERGEQASTQDRSNWLDMIQGRREEYVEPMIIRPFVNQCIEYGILPKPVEEYSVQWADLWSQSDKEKVDIGKVRAEALKAYTSAPGAMDTVPPEVFYRFFLGLAEEQIELITEMQEAAVVEEERDFKEETE